MNKKKLVLLPALGLVLAGLAGCTQPKTSQEQQSVVTTSEQGQTSAGGDVSVVTSTGGTSDSVVHVTSVKLNKNTLELEVDASENLTVTVLPENATSKKVTWSSSDANVATVSNLGKVKGVKEGTAVITVKSEDGNIQDTCAVTIKKAGARYGNAQNPITIAQALTIASEECKVANDVSAEEVYITGFVVRANPSAGSNADTGATYTRNVYVADAAGEADQAKHLWVYSANYTGASNLPYQNDKVTLHGYIKNYNGTIEITDANNVTPTIIGNVRGTSKVTWTEDGATFVGDKPATKTNGETVSFKVNVESGKELSSVKVNGEAITADAQGNYVATIKGDTTIKAEAVTAGKTVTEYVMAYAQGAGTTSMDDGVNNAAKVGLDANIFDVRSAKNKSANTVGLNNAGDIRLYEDRNGTKQGSSITITSSKVVIEKIEVEFASTTKTQVLRVNNGTADVTLADGAYAIGSSKVILQNVVEATASMQLHMKKVTLYTTEKEQVAATSVTVNKTTLSLMAGIDEVLTATIAPENSTSAVVWTSSDETVAKVSGGSVKTYKAGTATITAFADNNGNGTYDAGEPKSECALTVTANDVVNEVANPVAGTEYVINMKTENRTNRFVDGKEDSYGNPTTSTLKAEAAKVTVEAGSKAGTVKVKVGDKYLVALKNGGYVNMYLKDSGATEFATTYKYDNDTKTVNGLFVNSTDLSVAEGKSWTGTDGVFYVGNYSTKTTLNTSAISYLIKDNKVADTQWRAVISTIA